MESSESFTISNARIVMQAELTSVKQQGNWVLGLNERLLNTPMTQATLSTGPVSTLLARKTTCFHARYARP